MKSIYCRENNEMKTRKLIGRTFNLIVKISYGPASKLANVEYGLLKTK